MPSDGAIAQYFYVLAPVGVGVLAAVAVRTSGWMPGQSAHSSHKSKHGPEFAMFPSMNSVSFPDHV
jgi:hypothetical protein